ncbi:MAG: hypothetical protein M1834_007317 [Cirrosporium novae-zelandiae]|nr:MAG: hypothetical protein M1834_007317 [Cirrosporium novae-zelandiae]
MNPYLLIRKSLPEGFDDSSDPSTTSDAASSIVSGTTDSTGANTTALFNPTVMVIIILVSITGAAVLFFLGLWVIRKWNRHTMKKRKKQEEWDEMIRKTDEHVQQYRMRLNLKIYQLNHAAAAALDAGDEVTFKEVSKELRLYSGMR